MKAVKVTDKVYWVGAIDRDIKDFHGYSVNKGTTYNAYLVVDEKVVLIDTVREGFYDEMMERIRSVIDPSKIDIVISNHAELDHSAMLPQVIKDVKPEKVYASTQGVANIEAQMHLGLDITAVKTGDSIDTGSDKITFYESELLHWPDSMISFLEGDAVLFSNDIFGMHYATDKLFDDENDINDWKGEMRKYYSNIITPYSDIVLRFLEFVKGSGLLEKIKIIAPDHGFVWRKDPGYVVNFYKEIASMRPENKAVIVYDTMWGNTAKIASAVAEGIKKGGSEAVLMSLREKNRSDIVTELSDAGALVLGVPVMNYHLYPSMGDIIWYLKGINKRNLIGAAFGSYGWTPKDLDKLFYELEDIDVEVIAPVFKVKFAPSADDLIKAEEFGTLISEKLQEHVKKFHG